MPWMPRSGAVRIACVEACELETRAGKRTAMLWNVSVLGVYLVIDPLPEIGETLRVTFHLPQDPEPVRVAGRVAWLNPPTRTRGLASKAIDLPSGCGVEFIDLSAADRERIESRVKPVAAAAWPRGFGPTDPGT